MTNQQKSYLIGAVGLVVIVGILWWGNRNQAATTDTEKVVHIGVIIPLSGQAVYYGEQVQKGIEVAKEVVRDQYPNIEINLHYGDSLYTPKGGVDAYQSLKNQAPLNAVVTLASPVSLAIQPLAMQDGILQMAVATTSGKYSSPDDLSFRTIPAIDVQAKLLVEYIQNNNLKRIGALYLNNDFGISAKDKLKEHLGTQGVTLEEGFTIDQADFRTQLTKLKQSNPDGVFLTGTAAHYSSILKQAVEMNLDTQFISISSAEDPVLLRNTGELAEGVIYSYYDIDESNPTAKAFIDSYKEKHAVMPEGYAAEGYEALRLIADAWNECGSDKECIKNFLQNIKNNPSVFGLLSYDKNGDVMYDFTLKTVKNGAFVKYE